MNDKKFSNNSDKGLIQYTVIFEPISQGGYNVVVPAIPEICTSGNTSEEARAMAKDAITCYLRGVRLEGKPFPPNIPAQVEDLTIAID